MQVAEAALADEHVRGGDRLALQRRVLRLGKPPRRWRQPAWIDQVPCEPPEVCIEGRPIASRVGAKSMFWSAEGEAVNVEDLALLHYASEHGGGWHGDSLPLLVSV
jgi:Fanconi-associated nuclease 1